MASMEEDTTRPPLFRPDSTEEARKARVRAIMAGLPDPGPPSPKGEPTEAERERAAGTIQKNYRGHRARRQLQGFGLDPQTRWMEAVKDAQYRRLTTPQAPAQRAETEDTNSPPPPTARSKWTRATKIAQRAGADDESLPEEESDLSDSQPESALAKLSTHERTARKERRDAAKAARKKEAKMMDLQYFLEMVDQKHRYGSHLRKYHAYWKTLDTDQSFFYWLDHGDGLTMDMPECTREKLDAEQVRYLSREERLHYMVRIDGDGLLRWAKNGELVWTKDELYKDSIKGIVRTDEDIPEYKYNVPPVGANVESSSEDGGEDFASDSSDDEEGNGKQNISLASKPNDSDSRYVNEEFHRARGPAKLKHVSAAVLFNHMIRTSMKKGHKWIFVADTSFNLYIGYKQSGAFQHSSFMHGSRITAAGVIKVKHGQLRSLAPLSGHYRPPARNFRSFVHSLEDEGCDMRRVNISKSYAILMGMERYLAAKGRVDSMKTGVKGVKDRVVRPEEVRRREEESRDKTESARREREWIESQREQVRLQQQGKGEKSKGAGGLVKRWTGKLGIGKSKKNNGGGGADDPLLEPEMAQREPGTGPVDGVPAPEGKRVREQSSVVRALAGQSI